MITIGVDAHKRIHVALALDEAGREIGESRVRGDTVDASRSTWLSEAKPSTRSTHAGPLPGGSERGSRARPTVSMPERLHCLYAKRRRCFRLYSWKTTARSWSYSAPSGTRCWPRLSAF